MNDPEGPRAQTTFSRNWLAIFAVLILIGAAAFLLELVAGSHVSSAASSLSLTIISAFALIEGGWRLFGNEGFLGPGTGFDRLLAIFQILLSLTVLTRILT